MTKKRLLWTGFFLAVAMLVMIIDAKIALLGAKEGLALCLYSVIPSLFPFFLISGMLNSLIAGQRLTVLRPVGKLCRIPEGSESILLLGLLGGYPVGARSIQQSYKAGQLSKRDAERMLGFCNNAGPAFIFGMVAGMFSDVGIAWLLWGLHILSAILVGVFMPGKAVTKCNPSTDHTLTLTKALENAIKTTAIVCGWVILFRVVIAYLNRWFLWTLPASIQTLCIGFLELSNGCCELDRITNAGLRFVVAAGILAFGGACVSMQVSSVTDGLEIRAYFPGKFMQFIISVLLAGAIQTILFPPSERLAITHPLWAGALGVLGIQLFFMNRKNVVAIRRKMIYNTLKSR